jgi:hypothetical protein
MSPIAIIDFEAPALSFHVRSIEVGLAIWHPGASIRTWSSLIRRDEQDAWSDQSEAIHKIMREDLQGAPTAERVAMALNSLLAPIGTAFCDGMPYDEIWCRVLFQDADVKREFGLRPMAMLPLQDGARMV